MRAAFWAALAGTLAVLSAVPLLLEPDPFDAFLVWGVLSVATFVCIVMAVQQWRISRP